MFRRSRAALGQLTRNASYAMNAATMTADSDRQLTVLRMVYVIPSIIGAMIIIISRVVLWDIGG